MGLLLMPIIAYGMPYFSRYDRVPETRSLFKGIDYRREVRSLPRPIVIHVELTDLAQALGADSALNLDGGGSVTLAVATPSGAKALNSPIHSKIPMNERPISSHLGFYAE